MASISHAIKRAYRLESLGAFGAVVKDVDLTKNLNCREFQAGLKSDLDQYGLLLFRDQHNLQPEHHVGVAALLGRVFPLPKRYQHHKSPHPDILRVSNSQAHGFHGVGASAWHIDGVTYPSLFGHCFFQIVNVPTRGSTLFLPLGALAHSLLSKGCGWDRYWVRFQGRGEGGTPDPPAYHPLIYSHPRTGLPGVCLGRIGTFVIDKGTKSERFTDAEETKCVHSRLVGHIPSLEHFVYQHQWEDGDFIILDNLAVAHLASPETQMPVEDVGLRVLHRVVTAGNYILQSFQQ